MADDDVFNTKFKTGIAFSLLFGVFHIKKDSNLVNTGSASNFHSQTLAGTSFSRCPVE